jgi:DNA (cytosine-5)-methyltransferase 1
LLNAGWKGLFALEKNKDAFGTFAQNLISGPRYFDWPSWLPIASLSTEAFLDEYVHHLAKYKGKVTLLAGGPPCQGFSLAGRRLHSDPRNRLTDDYLQIVGILMPRFLLIENVQGFNLPFKKSSSGNGSSRPHAEVVTEHLHKLGYIVFSKLIDLSDFGVPQRRRRFIILAIKEGDACLPYLAGADPIELLLSRATAFRRKKRLRAGTPITAIEAIGDLETVGRATIENTDSGVPGFREVAYTSPARPTRYQALLRRDAIGRPNSMRLAKHLPSTTARFSEIVASCDPGRSLNDVHRKRLGIKKHATTLLAADQPASTITTLPDDIIHYAEPRILTVRENARFQTFPDWFNFTGKYTSGGKMRKSECPRYSQVGNAVPPLFGEAVGLLLRELSEVVG